ncbi:MAG: glutamine--fructose-6-phosphate transaminase (isomerizing) [Actinomycetota bacterium]|nr:glutamine--fructose-6-phosphate transaminase (isomerizing) [Actinomycetota bacterium]
MCGIFGVTGLADPLALVAAGLRALEYRGYDSAGIVTADVETHELWRCRAAERGRSIEKLETQLHGAPAHPGATLGHTRWATHGAPNEENAHPHLDCSGRIGLVHNGIIENHRELALELSAAGHAFSSATDTETFVHLVEAKVRAGACLREAVASCLGSVTGDFAVALVDAAEPHTIVAARRTSPLIFGRTDSGAIVSSDIAAALPTTRDLYQLGDDQIVELSPDAVVVIDASGAPATARRLEVAWSVEAAQKSGYPDFMSKEIAEQPVALTQTLLGRFSPAGVPELEELALSGPELAAFRRVVLVACGSSYHACLSGRDAIERLAKVPAEVDIASEFRYREAVLGADTLVVAVSQSGETIDTLHALREARRRGAKAIAVSNVVDSVMAREADGVIYTHAGPEIGVASTKCHLAQHALLAVFALHLAHHRGELSGERLAAAAAELTALPGLVEAALTRSEEHAAVARRYAGVNDFYFLGRRSGFTVAAEGALKLKELAYVRAEAYPAGEMKHGPISLIEPGAVVVVIAPRDALWEKVMANVEEMRARGATVVAVCEEGDQETEAAVDAVLRVPSTGALARPIVGVVPLQRFAYEIAQARGNDVDRPRNLAKVVTVE